MAPVTPSPHRFVSGSRRQASPAKESRLRQEAASSRPKATEQPASGPGGNQFARPPRFSFGRAPRTAQPLRPAQPPRPLPTQSQSLGQALRTRPTDDVEETRTAQNEDDEMLDVEQAEALPTIENSLESRELPYSPKRRRYLEESNKASTHAAVASPIGPTFRPPTTPASHMAAAQFVRPSSVSATTANGSRMESTGPQIRRPAFLRSSLAPSEQREPLPEAFSPHRRGEKFVPGGMAATLQQWVIETGQVAAQSRRGQGYLRGEDYVTRCVVIAVSGQGPLKVRGKQSDGSDVKLLLMADSKQTSLAVGSDLGVRAPVWDVQLEGERWTVGVDWKSLQ